MIQPRLSRRCALPVLLLASPLCGELRADEPVYRSPLAVVADRAGERLFVAEATAGTVAEFHPATRTVVRRYELPGPLGGLALSADETHLYVTQAVPRGRVHVLDLATATTQDGIDVGHTPGSIVAGPEGDRLLVCNRFDNNVSVVDLAANEAVAAIEAVREPIAAAVTSDGASLLVANLLPAGRADGDYVAATVTVIDARAGRFLANINLPDGSTALRSICVAPDDRYAYVTHLLARYHVPTTQLERGWISTNAVSVIDVNRRALVNTVLLDELDLGAANPWGIACTGGGRYLAIAHAGTHEVSVIDRHGLHERLARAAAGEQVTEVSSSAGDVRDDLAFLVGLRRRVPLEARGPRGLTAAGDRIYVAEYFSDSLGEVRLDVPEKPEVHSYPLAPPLPLNPVRRGEMLFHDATMCFQQWQSCASCHPGEARTDGLNWDLLNDGIGNPKNTRSLLLAHETPPAMALGVRSTAEAAVRAGIAHIQLMVRPEEDAAAIDAYLRSLRPVPSPYLVDGKPDDAARRGGELFVRAGCAACHTDPLYTDLNAYDVGTGRGLDKEQVFDTPTLVELWRTAPYLHDGRAGTVREVLTRCNPHDEHGRTSDLSESELEDLERFLLTR